LKTINNHVAKLTSMFLTCWKKLISLRICSCKLTKLRLRISRIWTCRIAERTSQLETPVAII